MRKYAAFFSAAAQDTLQRRASLLADRLGTIALVVSLWALWSAILGPKDQLAGFTRTEMLTYVLGLNLLRSWVLTTRAFEVVTEIAAGRIVPALLQPIDYLSAVLAKDLAGKSIRVGSAVLEISLLVAFTGAAIALPGRPGAWLLAAAAALLALLVHFHMMMTVALAAFWTSESRGPLFFFDLLVYFAAGAYFPLDLLPGVVQGTLRLLPFALLVDFPLRLFLDKVPPAEIARGFLLGAGWLLVFVFTSRAAWRRGLLVYDAEGS